MDINTARQQLLNVFPQKYRQHILDFSSQLTELDVDVLIFTARKSACFFHCLEYLRLWDSRDRIVTTDRLVDHDMQWLKGKRIAVIDEVIVSGTSLFRLLSTLRAVGISRVEVHALFINEEWFVKDFFKGDVLSDSHIALSGPEAQALGTTIVRALHCIPRPYSIDYPMSGWNSLNRTQINFATHLPGWKISILDEIWAKHAVAGHGSLLEYYRFEPERSSLSALSEKIGIELKDAHLVKVRTYGKWDTIEGKELYYFRVVPYLVLSELTSGQIDLSFNKIVAKVSDSERLALENSCVTGKSRLRVMQYVFASRLGRIWAEELKKNGVNVSFVEDQREVSFVFPTIIHKALSELISLTSLKLEILYGVESIEQQALPEHTSVQLTASQYLRLAEPFINMYLGEEIASRKNAKNKGDKYFDHLVEKSSTDRLNRGLTIKELANEVLKTGDGISSAQLSSFIDVAVDSGIIVPITIERIGNDSTVLTRAYRHGEETYILPRDLAIIHEMLVTLAEVIRKKTSGMVSSSALALPHRLTKIILEKALVLFVRHAISEGIFPRVYVDAEDRDPRARRVGIGYDLLGARVSLDEHLSTELPQNQTFVNWLILNNILINDGEHGYEINKGWKHSYSKPDKSQLAFAVSFSSVLGSAVGLLAQTANSKNLTSKSTIGQIDRALVALTTCESEASVLMAIGAELRRFDNELKILNVAEESKVELIELVEKPRFTDYVELAVNSGYVKLMAFINEEARTNAEMLSSRISEQDRVYGGVWDSICESSRRDQSPANTEIFNKRIVDASATLLKCLLLTHWARKNALIEAKASQGKIAKAKKSFSKKVTDISRLAQDLATSSNAMHIEFAKAFKDAITYIEDFEKKSGQEWAYTSQLTMNEFIKLRVVARDQYEWIDHVTQDDGRIAKLEEYDSIATFFIDVDKDIWNLYFAKNIQDITASAIKRFHEIDGPPRQYARTTGRVPAGGKLRALKIDDTGERIVLSVVSADKRGVVWLGYIFANCVKLFTQGGHIPLKFSASVILGLEKSRKIHRNTSTSVIEIPTTAKALSRLGRRIMAEPGVNFSIVNDTVGAKNFRDAFVEEISNTLRAGVKTVSTSSVPVTGAGGEFTAEALVFPGTPRVELTAFKVAWVVIVEDEGASALIALNKIGVKPQSTLRADRKIVLEAILPTQTRDITLRIFMSSGQGNMNVANLLGNIASTETDIKFIVVSGICCSFSNDESLTKVTIPLTVLDTQNKVNTEKELLLRTSGGSMAVLPQQLVRWYLTFKKKRILESPGLDIDNIKVLDNQVMVSDNDLMRNSNSQELHRTLARAFSDKAIGYDMETAGVFAWGNENLSAPPAVVIKGLADRGAFDKMDDDNRTKAAENAMRISLDFIELSSNHDFFNRKN